MPQVTEYRDKLDLESFAIHLKDLLRWAEDSGLAVDDFCKLAESILAEGWAK